MDTLPSPLSPAAWLTRLKQRSRRVRRRRSRPRRTGTNQRAKNRSLLPTAIGSAFRTGQVRAAVDVSDSRLGLIRSFHQILLNRLPALSGTGEGIFRKRMQIPGGDQIVQRLRGFVLVLRVLVDGLAHGEQVFS